MFGLKKDEGEDDLCISGLTFYKFFLLVDKLNINPEIIGNMIKNIYEKKKIKNILKLKVF